jgi:hypothetical protein
MHYRSRVVHEKTDLVEPARPLVETLVCSVSVTCRFTCLRRAARLAERAFGITVDDLAPVYERAPELGVL